MQPAFVFSLIPRYVLLPVWLLAGILFLHPHLSAQVNLNQGLMAYYPFNGNANDVSGNGNHGILQGGVSFTFDKYGNQNSAVRFDGVNDFIEVVHNGMLGRRNAFSFVINFKTESLSAVQTLLARRNRVSQQHAQFQAFINWNVHPGFGYGQSYTNNSMCNTVLLNYNVYVNTGAGSIVQDQWHCVVGTFDGTQQKIYLDGVLMESLSTPLSFFDSCANTPLTMGKYTDPDPQYFRGTMDEVRLYDRALTQMEVNALCTQVIASFEVPDTVCVNEPVTIANTSQNASSYYWNFCVADLNLPPAGVNLGNTGGILSQPVFMDYVLYNNNYYGFLINHYPGKLVRLDFGNSLLNTPTTVDLGNFGGIIPPGYGAEGIQVVFNEGKWYAIIVGGYTPSGSTPRVLKIDFGANLLNLAPVATNWGNIGNLWQPVDLHVFQEGNNWYGFTVNAENNTITRFNFTNSFDNTPTAVNIGGFGLLNYPTGIFAINDNGFWRVFISNQRPDSRITRLDFGSSLLNSPTAVDLGSVGGAEGMRDLSIINICGQAVGFTVNGITHKIHRLNFATLSSVPTVTDLGNIGNLNFPHSIAKLFRVNDDLYTFITNVANNTITRLRFTGCTSSSPGSSTSQNPPSLVYTTPGVYNINLTVDDGLPTQSSFCKQVVVLAAPVHSPTQNMGLCNGQSIKIGSSVKPATYLWNTGATTDSIIINTPGIYWVESNRYGCSVRDSFIVTRNIDSVRIDSFRLSCNSFAFNGLAYVNTYAVATWQWSFGDGGTASTQNANHTYATSGTFPVKLVVTDVNNCKDSITINVVSSGLSYDFSYSADVCNPLAVQFSHIGTSTDNPYWSFGDGNSLTGILNPAHTYLSPGNYTVRFSVNNGACTDTITKVISIGAIPDNIILTLDTMICYGTTKQLLAAPALSFCWTPATYLSDPNSHQPVTSTPHSITYYYLAEVTGSNLIVNGSFSQGNTGFTSDYSFAGTNTTEGQYFVGPNPQSWNPSLSNCTDHTGGNGNMLLVNGSPTPNVTVWKQTVAVTPNTNYAFSTWIQALWPPNPAQLQFSINGKDIGPLITASIPVCTWTQFYTTWNSGSQTTAVISIVNKNTQVQGNDFALDDISFAPVFIRRDSVRITVDTPFVRTNNDTTICRGASVQLNTTGAQQYAWSPSGGLSSTAIANPVAAPLVTTQYIVAGTNNNGCIARDTVNISLFPTPVISVSNDTAICRNTSVQLFATGGNSYNWSPANSLSNPADNNPVASPAAATTYQVLITDANNCVYPDSVKVDILPAPLFAVNPNTQVCMNGSVQLNASGGDVYSWQPAASLSSSSMANPVASPAVTTTYSVTIQETTCGESATLTTEVMVLPLPNVNVSKSNDIDCSFDKSQLTATGASQYSWTPAGTLSNPAISNPVASPVTTTQYTVLGTDANGCVASDTVTVFVENVNKGGYLMPTAFTPNNDGLNDCYRIKFWGVIEELDFSIYNRWGERVFYTKDPGACWDGTYKGVMQETAVFVYMIRAKTTCEENVFRKGTLLLIR